MKQLVNKLLIRRTARFINKKRPKIVVVTGSVGKTSTTQAIATVLSEKFKVLTTRGNYNTEIGVVLTIFGQEIVTNPLAWFWTSLKVLSLSFRRPVHDVYVLELGTDHPGEIKNFRYLNPDVAVVTAIAPEHMEYFKTIEAVASEELAVMSFSKLILLNKTMVPRKFVDEENAKHSLSHQSINYYSREDVKKFSSNLKVNGDHSLDAVAAAAEVARNFGFSESEVRDSVEKIVPQPGRMNELDGVNDSILIDDTYNSSPDAAIAALDYLYSVAAKQRIALLGNMNELGDHSESAHRAIGKLCDPKKLDFIVTLGVDSNRFLAAEAEKAGCKAIRCQSPVEAGEKIKDILKENAVVLLKGSQNGVYAEEATKVLLANPEDAIKLVRQTGYWPKKKRAQFSDLII